MDGFSGYNQIKISQINQHKTTFSTMWGTLYYHVMPFGLKNAGATYQRTMIVMLHDLIHKIMKDYVDNLLAKSKTRVNHASIQEHIFECLA